MDNKERVSRGGENGNEWDNLAEVEFSAEGAAEKAAEKVAEKAAEKSAEKAAEKSKEKKLGNFTVKRERKRVEPSVQEQFKAVEKENREIVHPKVVEFLAGKEPEIGDGENPSDYLVYNISSDKRGAVRKELAGQAFEDQIFKADNYKDFLAAKRLASEIERDETIDPAIKERINEYRNDPASGYAEKDTFFNFELTEKMIGNDEKTLALAKEQYEQAREGGFFHRLLNRRDIKEKEARVKDTENRISRAQATLEKQRVEFVKARAAKREAEAAKASKASKVEAA